MGSFAIVAICNESYLPMRVQSVEKNQNVDVQKREEEFEEEILAKAQLTDRELDRLVALHQSQMEDFDGKTHCYWL